MKNRFVFILKKTLLIFGVFFAFILTAMLALFLPCVLDFALLYVITIPLGIAIIITMVQMIDWDELFDFEYYE